MSKFIKNTIAFLAVILIPLLLLSVFYICLDPFKVIKRYEVYYDKNSKGVVSINRDYVSTMNFINRYKTEQYNSFIFGNSRSIFYQISDWKQHLDSTASCYHFDASGESIYAINKKLEFLAANQIPTKNVLLILDASALAKNMPQNELLNIISPILVDYSNFVEFHIANYKAFLTPDFLYAFLDYKLTDSVKPYMINNKLLLKNHITYNEITNEIRYDFLENEIKANHFYTEAKRNEFYKRSTQIKDSKQVIHQDQLEILNNIASTLRDKNANVKVVISPLYDQKRINRNDLHSLERVFGQENVFDFSGKNSFTENYRNYYETSHYRPHIARAILKLVYKND